MNGSWYQTEESPVRFTAPLAPPRGARVVSPLEPFALRGLWPLRLRKLHSESNGSWYQTKESPASPPLVAVRGFARPVRFTAPLAPPRDARVVSPPEPFALRGLWPLCYRKLHSESNRSRYQTKESPRCGPEDLHEGFARPVRFERTTFGSVDRRSIQLSYGRLREALSSIGLACV